MSGGWGRESLHYTPINMKEVHKSGDAYRKHHS